MEGSVYSVRMKESIGNMEGVKRSSFMMCDYLGSKIENEMTNWIHVNRVEGCKGID